jgi:hypothetical protein
MLACFKEREFHNQAAAKNLAVSASSITFICFVNANG